MRVSSANELLQQACIYGSISKAVIAGESQSRAQPAAEIISQMHRALAVMRDSVAKGMAGDRRSLGGLVGGEAARLKAYASEHAPLAGAVAARATMMAMAVSEVNASMGRIVAAPTAGSCGILPGALFAAAESLSSTDDAIVEALFVAAGIGMVIARNATISGAEGGCQAECGAATAMAAAACASLASADPETCVNAAALALKNELGLACDPIAGLVEVPCAKRNAIKAPAALVAADMSLAGIKSVIPFDEVVLAMHNIAREMPASLRETAMGGLAATPTGIRLKTEILGEQRKDK